MASSHSSAAGDTCDDGSAKVDACNDGDTRLAVLDSQGIGATNTAHSDVCLPSKNSLNSRMLTRNNQIIDTFRYNNLPVELQNKIIGFGMTAKNHEFHLPCLTNASYTPNVTAGLMLASHRIYHEAHYQIRKQNTFIFGHLGSDLKTIASSIGPLKCRTGACGHAPLRSTISKVVFDLGDEELPDHGDDKVHAFGCALRYLRSDIIVSSLHINLAYHTFSTSTQLSWFAFALSKIKVQENFTVTGHEKVLDMSFGELPIHLGMHLMPVYSNFWTYNPGHQYSTGWFLYQYASEKHFAKVADPLHERSVVEIKYIRELVKSIGERLDGYVGFY